MIEINLENGKSIWIAAGLVHKIVVAVQDSEHTATSVTDTTGIVYLTEEPAAAVAARVATALGRQAVQAPKPGSAKAKLRTTTPMGKVPSGTGWQA